MADEEFVAAAPQDDSAAEPSTIQSDTTQPSDTNDFVQLNRPETETKLKSRSPSPLGNNSQEFLIDTQINRTLILDELKQHYAQFTADQFTLENVKSSLKIVNDLWAQFNSDHEKIGATCKKATFNHPYVKSKFFSRAFFAYHNLNTMLSNQLARLTELATQQQSTRTTTQTTRPSSTPRLSALHIQIYGNNSAVKCNSTQLNTLISTVTESLDALKTLGLPVKHWDAILVHQITQRFDHQLLSAWENTIGRSSEVPHFDQLKNFLWDKARAQERIESAHPSNKSDNKSNDSNQHKPYLQNRSIHYARTHAVSTTTKSLSHHYPCDQCGGDHYIVSCAAFRALPPAMRRDLVIKSRLCFNCFGHHDVARCASTRSCVTCHQRLHTMIHIGSTQPATTQSATPSTSTQPSTSN